VRYFQVHDALQQKNKYVAQSTGKRPGKEQTKLKAAQQICCVVARRRQSAARALARGVTLLVRISKEQFAAWRLQLRAEQEGSL
jgi:hypothetical protein